MNNIYSTLMIIRGIDLEEINVIEPEEMDDMPSDYIKRLKEMGYDIVYQKDSLIIFEKKGNKLNKDGILQFRFNGFREVLEHCEVKEIEDTTPYED